MSDAKRGGMDDVGAVAVGGSVWVDDGLRRRSFRCEVTGESATHWTIRCYGEAAKVPKARRKQDAPYTRFAPQPEGLRLRVFFTDEALADHRWIEEHRAGVALAVQSSGDAARLRRAAAAVGYDDGSRPADVQAGGFFVRSGDSRADGGCLLCNRHEPDAQGAVPPHAVAVVRGSGGAEVRICTLCAHELRTALAGVAVDVDRRAERGEEPKPAPAGARADRFSGESDEDYARRLRSMRNARYRRSPSRRKGLEK